MTFLSEDDLEWVKIIPDSNQFVIFKSNKGNVDTIVYSRKWIHNDKKWYAAGENSNGVREANVGYDFHFINHNTSKYERIGFDGYFGIYRELNNDVLQSSFSFSNIRSFSKEVKKRDLTPLFKINLNNKIYNNCFVIDSLNSSCKTSKYLEMRELKKIYYL